MSETKDIAELLEHTKGAEIILLEGKDSETVQVVARPAENGAIEIESVKTFLDEYRECPERRVGTAKLTSLRSFIDHVNRFKDSGSVVFVNDSEKPHLLAVLDYHLIGAGGLPRFCAHKTSYSFPISVEWQEWEKASRSNGMSQQDFGLFLEERGLDIVEPETGTPIVADLVKRGVSFGTPQTMIELGRGLTVHVNQTCSNEIDSATGECRLTWIDEHQAPKGQSRVPGAFMVAIPVFHLGTIYRLPVRLNYRLEGEKIRWWLKVVHPELALQNAIEEAVGLVATETELPIFFGSPEA